MTSPIVSNEMYVILGASGNTGSIVANFLLSKGKKVRVVGRDSGRLKRFVDKGAEAFTADMSNVAALTKAFSGARAAYLLLPPAKWEVTGGCFGVQLPASETPAPVVQI